jgi:Spy/CpxP family protein refolding chaperone
MKRNLLVFTAVGALALGGFGVALAEHGPGGGHGLGGGHGQWQGHGFGLEHMTKSLNLTPDQQAKVQPIVDQMRPQIVAIHREAMQKAKSVVDDTMSKIRPLLTPEQQKKFDDLKKAHEDMRKAHEELHAAMQE